MKVWRVWPRQIRATVGKPGIGRVITSAECRHYASDRRERSVFPNNGTFPDRKGTPYRNEKDWLRHTNSYSLRQKIQELCEQNKPDQAERILKESAKIEGAVYAWNILIKYYSKWGKVQEAHDLYNNMKKIGIEPILDTHVQMAFGICTLQKLQRSSSPPKPRWILDVVRRIEEMDYWKHKGIGVLLAALANTAREVDHKDEQTISVLVENAKKVWQKIYPKDDKTENLPAQFTDDLNHYILILSMSSRESDWKIGEKLLPRLPKFPSLACRHNALRIANRLKDQNLAKHYWHLFADQPFQPSATLTYLRILSVTYDAKEAYDTLCYYIDNVKPEFPKIGAYVYALIACARLPNLETATRVYKKISENPETKQDFKIQALFFDIFNKATISPYALKKHTPTYIYSVLRLMDLPSLLRRRDVPARRRLFLLEDIVYFIQWRLKAGRFKANDPEEVVKGDMKFYMRWQGIIKNQDKGENMDEENKDETNGNEANNKENAVEFHPVERVVEERKSRKKRENLELDI